MSKKRRGVKLKAETWQLYSMCVIPLFLVILFHYVPMGGIVIAFKNYRYDKGIFGSDWVGLKNFKYFMGSRDFMRLLRNTVLNNLLFIITETAASVGLAILLYQIRSRAKTKAFQTALITPHFISWVVAGYMIYAFLNPQYGIVNGLLEKMNLPAVEWYSKPSIWPVILAAVNIWKHVGMDSVVYYAALMGIDSALIEAAKIDGANKRQITTSVILPELRSLVIILTLLSIGKIFRADFGLFYFIPRNIGQLYPTTDVFDTYIFRQLRINSNLTLGAASGLWQSVVGFVTVLISNAVVKKLDSDSAIF